MKTELHPQTLQTTRQHKDIVSTLKKTKNLADWSIDTDAEAKRMQLS